MTIGAQGPEIDARSIDTYVTKKECQTNARDHWERIKSKGALDNKERKVFVGCLAIPHKMIW